MSVLGQKTATYAIKTILMGDGGVGKSNIIYRGCHNTFKGDSKMTIGAAFHVKELKLSDTECTYTMKYQLWDLGGQEHFRIMMPEYCRGARCCIAAFDVARFMTLNNLKSWFDILYTKNQPVVPTAIIATKYDLYKPGDTTQVQDDAVQDFIQGLQDKYENYKRMPPVYVKTSAKTGQGVEGVFQELGALYTKYLRMPFCQ